jgi:hypothetical protein
MFTYCILIGWIEYTKLDPHCASKFTDELTFLPESDTYFIVSQLLLRA